MRNKLYLMLVIGLASLGVAGCTTQKSAAIEFNSLAAHVPTAAGLGSNVSDGIGNQNQVGWTVKLPSDHQ